MMYSLEPTFTKQEKSLMYRFQRFNYFHNFGTNLFSNSSIEISARTRSNGELIVTP